MHSTTRSLKRKPIMRGAGAWIVYVVRCGDGTLYTGITVDIDRRVRQHNAGIASRYTRVRRPVKVVHQEPHANQSAALKRELAIKSMTRREKLSMIQTMKRSN